MTEKETLEAKALSVWLVVDFLCCEKNLLLDSWHHTENVLLDSSRLETRSYLRKREKDFEILLCVSYFDHWKENRLAVIFPGFTWTLLFLDIITSACSWLFSVSHKGSGGGREASDQAKATATTICKQGVNRCLHRVNSANRVRVRARARAICLRHEILSANKKMCSQIAPTSETSGTPVQRKHGSIDTCCKVIKVQQVYHHNDIGRWQKHLKVHTDKCFGNLVVWFPWISFDNWRVFFHSDTKWRCFFRRGFLFPTTTSNTRGNNWSVKWEENPSEGNSEWEKPAWSNLFFSLPPTIPLTDFRHMWLSLSLFTHSLVSLLYPAGNRGEQAILQTHTLMREREADTIKQSGDKTSQKRALPPTLKVFGLWSTGVIFCCHQSCPSISTVRKKSQISMLIVKRSTAAAAASLSTLPCIGFQTSGFSNCHRHFSG